MPPLPGKWQAGTAAPPRGAYFSSTVFETFAAQRDS
jgi:hypothetical protein